MKIRDCRNTLREIDSVELDQQLSDKSVTHIARCGSCREASEQGSSLRRLVAGFETVSAPPDFDMRLRARLAAEKKPVTAWINLWRQAPGVPAFALALSLLVVVTLAIYLRPAGAGTDHAALSPRRAEATTDVTPVRASPSNPVLATGNGAAGDKTGITRVNVRDERKAGVRRSGKSNAELAAATKGSGVASREFSQLPASIIKRVTDNGAPTSPVVSLSAPAQPVVVSMRDDHGATRTISLPPVSFGSQRLVQPSYQSASLISSAKGAW